MNINEAATILAEFLKLNKAHGERVPSIEETTRYVVVTDQVPDAMLSILRDMACLARGCMDEAGDDFAEEILNAITPLLERGEEEDDG